MAQNTDTNSHPTKTTPFYRSGWGCLTLLIIFILGVPAGCQYNPPLNAIDGYTTQLVTDPSYFGSPVKWAQAFFEIIPCRYELLGWDENNTFYYRAECDGLVQLWQYDPQTSKSDEVDTQPLNLYLEEADRNDLLDIVRAEGVTPDYNEPSVRAIYLRGTGLVAPNGQYTAILTQHLYAVFDVVVLVAEEK